MQLNIQNNAIQTYDLNNKNNVLFDKTILKFNKTIFVLRDFNLKSNRVKIEEILKAQFISNK